MMIEIDDEKIAEANQRLKEMTDWEGTQDEWNSYVERLLMEDLGNL